MTYKWSIIAMRKTFKDFAKLSSFFLHLFSWKHYVEKKSTIKERREQPRAVLVFFWGADHFSVYALLPILIACGFRRFRPWPRRPQKTATRSRPLSRAATRSTPALRALHAFRLGHASTRARRLALAAGCFDCLCLAGRSTSGRSRTKMTEGSYSPYIC